MGLVGQCEYLGFEGGKEPLEDSAQRKDINGFGIFQHVSGCGVDTGRGGVRAGGGRGNQGEGLGLWMHVF